MDYINKREKELIRLLLEEEQYRPIAYFAKKLNVSSKTLQADLKQIRYYLRQYTSIEIKAGRGKGILLRAENGIKNRLLHDIGGAVTAEPEASTPRREAITKEMLLNTGEMTSLQKLSEMYYVGRTSIVNDMKYVENRLKKYNLELKKTKRGTYIAGTEANIRKAIAGLAIRENTRKGLLEIFSAEDIDFVENLLYTSGISDYADVSSRLDISDVYYINLLTHILISIKRVRENIHIESGDSGQSDEIAMQEHYRHAGEIAERINDHYQIQIGEEETRYIYQYLISSDIKSYMAKHELPADQTDIGTVLAKELSRRLSAEFQMDFEKDSDMIQGLILHIRPMLKRMQYNIQIDNPLREEVTRHYPDMIAACEKNLKDLVAEYLLPEISIDEVASIAIYYQTMLEKMAMRKRVVVVCHSGYGTSQLLAAKLKNEFAFLEIRDVVSTRMIREMDLKEVDFLIATVPVEREDVPCVIVSSLLLEQDIKAIRSYIMERG